MMEMHNRRRGRLPLWWAAVVCVVLIAWVGPSHAASQPTEPRIALVVGNGGAVRAPLPTAVNDAGLVAEALRTIGFDVVEGADLNQTDFARSFRQFLAKVDSAGANAIAVVYFSGYGFEFNADNYLVMADARLERDGDIPLDTVRMSDLLRAVAASPARAKIVISDASRRLPFAIQGVQLATGLGAVEAPRRTLVAYSSAPGMVAGDSAGPYGVFALAVAEMLRSPGLELTDLFARIRARTHQATQGRETPWNVSAVGSPVVLVPPDTSGASSPAMRLATLAPRAVGERSADDAYVHAIMDDTLSGYAEFLAAYPRHAGATRARSLMRARREALVWQHAVKLNSAASIWTYLHRYPEGMYAGDAQRRLLRLAAAPTPPSDFTPIEFPDIPLPPPDEPKRIADADLKGSPPSMLSDAQPAYLAELAPPSPRIGARVLPVPLLPAMARLTGGMRHPVASFTGLPGVAGPVATNGTQSGHSSGGMQLASAPAQASASPIAAGSVPLPPPAPRRAVHAERSRHLANDNCKSSRGKDDCE